MAVELVASNDEPARDSSSDRLRQHIEAIERLHEERAALADDIKDRWAMLKADGFDKKASRHIINLRKMETHARQEWDALVETYRRVLGLG